MVVNWKNVDLLLRLVPIAFIEMISVIEKKTVQVIKALYGKAI